MDTKTLEGTHDSKERGYTVEDYLEDDMEEEGSGGSGFAGDEKKKGVGIVYGKRGSTSGGSGGVSPPSCQVEECGVDLTDAKRYHRRHKVCEDHAKAPAVIVAGLRQRFCQQCSRFHELSEFDEAKRSCRRRLAGHNERRRKSSTAESYGEGSSRSKGSFSSQMKETQCSQVGQRGKYQVRVTTGNNSNYRRSQIR